MYIHIVCNRMGLEHNTQSKSLCCYPQGRIQKIECMTRRHGVCTQKSDLLGRLQPRVGGVCLNSNLSSGYAFDIVWLAIPLLLTEDYSWLVYSFASKTNLRECCSRLGTSLHTGAPLAKVSQLRPSIEMRPLTPGVATSSEPFVPNVMTDKRLFAEPRPTSC